MKQAALAKASFGSTLFKKRATVKMKTIKKPSRAVSKQLELRGSHSD